jgi:hypothetical protein
LEADAWLRAIEAKLDVLTSPCSEERKVKFAAMYLRGPALLWCDHFKMMQPNGHEITWAEFKTAFKNHHIPKGMVERKLNELLNLRQGSDSVYQYAQNSTTCICMVTTMLIQMPRKWIAFAGVLILSSMKKLNPIKTNNYHEIVDLAISQEDAMKKVQNAKKMKAAFNFNNAPKRKFRIVQKAPQNFQRNQRSGRWVAKPPQNQQQGNFRSPNFQQQNARHNAPPPARTNNEGHCYNCGKPGHFMNACPQPRQQNQGRGQPQNNNDKGKKQTVQVVTPQVFSRVY